jgi:hypothetical protein
MNTVRMLPITFALVSLLGLTGGCEDKECKAALATAKADAEKVQKELEAARRESAELRGKATKADDLTAQVTFLQRDLDAAKASAAPVARAADAAPASAPAAGAAPASAPAEGAPAAKPE